MKTPTFYQVVTCQTRRLEQNRRGHDLCKYMYERAHICQIWGGKDNMTSRTHLCHGTSDMVFVFGAYLIMLEFAEY